MNNKFYSGLAGIILATALFTGTASAESTKDNSSKFEFFEREDDTTSFVFNSSEEDKKKEKISEEFKTFGMIPVDIDKMVDKEELTGVNPLFFPSTDLSKVVQDWKVLGKQYIREETDLSSDVLLVLNEGAEVEVLNKEMDSWYKVKVTETIEVEHEGKTKKDKKTVTGYISSEYIQLLDEKEEKKVLKKHKKNVSKLEEELLEEIKEEIKEEEERKRKEEEERKRQEELKRQEEERKKQEELRKQQELERQKEAERNRQAQASKQKSNNSTSTTQTNNSPTVKSGDLMSNAQKYLGARYLYGASTSRTDAFDCSSFTQRVFKEAGIASLPRNSAAQASVGTTVSRSNLQVGDLVFFNTTGSGISHVGIYAGNNKFIGSQTSTGVAYADLNSSYWSSKYVTAKRVR